MATSSTFDADKLRATSEQLLDAAAAGRAAVRAADLANQGARLAAPVPRLALTSAIEHAAPAIGERCGARAQAAAARTPVRGLRTPASTWWKTTCRATLAVNQAGALRQCGSRLSRTPRLRVPAAALATPTRKAPQALSRAAGLTALVGTAAGAGYILQSVRTIEDPWGRRSTGRTWTRIPSCRRRTPRRLPSSADALRFSCVWGRDALRRGPLRVWCALMSLTRASLCVPSDAIIAKRSI